MKVFYTHESYATVVVYCLYLEFEHGTQFFLSDLQRANLRGQSHDGGVETLVLLLRDIIVTLVQFYRTAFYSYCLKRFLIKTVAHQQQNDQF